jgi:hypothetical protein
MVKVEFLIDHGTAKKGDKTEMFESTAKALETHKVVKILK